MSNNIWNSHLTPESLILNSFPATPTQSLEAYQPALGTSLGKRPRQLDVEDFTQSKRHESTGDYTLSSFSSASPQMDAVQGLSDEAADVCTTWFNKYAVLPSDRHIESLSQLTGESSDAIRQWFGRLLKQGMGGHDSAYKSQTDAMPALCWSDSYTTDLVSQQPLEFPASIPMTTQTSQGNTSTPLERRSSNDTTVIRQPASTLRGGKKQRCTPTEDRDLLARDPNKIYQCTRGCGKRYGRKCDWKRKEEESYPLKSFVCSLCTSQGVENVRPCFRKYHFVQHFRNIHPGVNSDEYEQASVVCAETEFPRNCGFCKHKFESRQDRIDHIAEHFKQGKCMLDWNKESNDNGDGTDSNDDDDDDDGNNGKPHGDGYDGAPSHPPPQSDPRDDFGPQYFGGGDYAGGGGGGSSGTGLLPDSFFQFKLSTNLEDSSIADQPQSEQQHIRQRSISQSEPDESLSPRPCTPRGRDASTAQDDQTSLAGDALSGRLVGGAKFPSQPLVARGVRVGKSGVGLIPDASQLPLDAHTDPAGRNTKNSPLESSLHCRTEELRVLTPAALNTSQGSTHSDSSHAMTVTFPAVLSSVLDASQRSTHAKSESIVSTVSAPAVLDTLQQFTPQSFLSVRLLGAGGFSTVDEVLHRATNLRLGRKTLKNRNATAIEELKKEVSVLQKLRHPHVIRFLGAYSKGDKMSILVSPVAETTLALWLEQATVQQPTDLVNTVKKMFGCLVSSVRYLHEQRPVVKHMDIKPQNILVAQGDQEFPRVVLCDFGISSSDDLNDGQHKPLTRRYVAPEVFDGFARKQAADIWSLGCVFAEMASAPFSRSNSKWLTFRREYSGRTGKHYWQDVPSLQGWLSSFMEEAASSIEQQVVGSLKDMLRADPNDRPTATLLSMKFSPAPCCLEWPNDKVAFPAPAQELEAVETLARKEGADCCDHHEVANVNIGYQKDDLQNAKSWIEECFHSHDTCRQLVTTDKTLPTRLVDTQPEGIDDSIVRVVDSASIVQGTRATEYATLSYVWNDSSVTLTTSRLQTAQLGLQRQALPQTLESGIQAAQKLGFRYVWVDSLCILQDSEADKQAECAMMATIFRNAALTIVLDQLNQLDVKPGLLLPNANANASVVNATKNANRTAVHLPASSALPARNFTTPGFGWDTRAWSLQERLLSRRLLHVCETQVYWECASLKASDTFPRGLSSLVWEKAHTKSHPNRPQRGKSGSMSITVKNVCGSQPQPEATRLRNCQWIHKEGGAQGDSMDVAHAPIRCVDSSAPLSSKGIFAPEFARKNSSAGNNSVVAATAKAISPDRSRTRSPYLKGLFSLSALADARSRDTTITIATCTSIASLVPAHPTLSKAKRGSEAPANTVSISARSNDNAAPTNDHASNCGGISAVPFWDSDSRREGAQLGTESLSEHPLSDSLANSLAHQLDTAGHSHPCVETSKKETSKKEGGME